MFFIFVDNIKFVFIQNGVGIIKLILGLFIYVLGKKKKGGFIQ